MSPDDRDKHKTLVLFRVWKDSGDVIALFPDVQADVDGFLCQSYMHVGQHGGADYIGVMQRTRAATPEEYEPLRRELVNLYGYNLDIRDRRTRRSYAERSTI